jgi:hypothetical protein
VDRDGRGWVRQVASILGVILVGGLFLGLIGWAAMGALPESDAADPDTEVDFGDPEIETSLAPVVNEVAIAAPGDAVVNVERCEVVDDVVQVGGVLRNTSGDPQAFVVHVAVLFDGELFDGLTTDVGVAELADGEEATWASPAGSVDPEDESQQVPACEIDRVGLGTEVAE